MLSFRVKGKRNLSSFGDFQEKHLNVNRILKHNFFSAPLYVETMHSIKGLLCMMVYVSALLRFLQLAKSCTGNKLNSLTGSLFFSSCC